jgi:hypothetical protein
MSTIFVLMIADRHTIHPLPENVQTVTISSRCVDHRMSVLGSKLEKNSICKYRFSYYIIKAEYLDEDSVLTTSLNEDQSLLTQCLLVSNISDPELIFLTAI